MSWHLVSYTPHNQHSHFWFRPFAGKIAFSLKSTGERSHLVHFSYCHYAIKYLISDMMDCHCLRVFRSRDRRIGKRSPSTGKCNHLVHFVCCHYVIKYFMRDMTNYHCLRVLRSDVRRIGIHSPVFCVCVFRTRLHGCSDAEPCRVPIQSTVVAIFLLGN